MPVAKAEPIRFGHRYVDRDSNMAVVRHGIVGVELEGSFDDPGDRVVRHGNERRVGDRPRKSNQP